MVSAIGLGFIASVIRQTGIRERERWSAMIIQHQSAGNGASDTERDRKWEGNSCSSQRTSVKRRWLRVTVFFQRARELKCAVHSKLCVVSLVIFTFFFFLDHLKKIHKLSFAAWVNYPTNQTYKTFKNQFSYLKMPSPLSSNEAVCLGSWEAGISEWTVFE